MVDDKTDLVEYIRLVGKDENFETEYKRRLYEDYEHKCLPTEIDRYIKLQEILK